jgi:hypothetical protein
VRAVSASIIVLAGAILTLQKADFLILVGMGVMAVGFLAWIVLIAKLSEPPK